MLKIYSQNENVNDENVFLFYANVLLIPFILLIIAKRSSIKKVFKSIAVLDKKSLLVSLGMVFSTIISVVGIFLIKTVDLVVYTVAEKALATIAIAVVSFIFFKEKFTPIKIVSFLLLILAVVLMGI